MTEKEREYADYIENHVNNVYKAYQLIYDVLKQELDFDDLDLVKRINTHDVSKWSDEEFDAYRKYFYPEDNETPDVSDDFERAWQHHYKVNDHHPEHYVINYAFYNDEIKQIIKEMPDAAIAEMFCDWTAMSLNFGTSLAEWFYSSKNEIMFNDTTFKKVVRIVDLLDEKGII